MIAFGLLFYNDKCYDFCRKKQREIKSERRKNNMDLLDRKNVKILERAADWKDAVRKSVMPLEEGGYVKPEYKEAIISGIEKLGPYIVIAPSIALPHARAEQGVLKSQIAITLFRNEVQFNREDAAAQLFVALAAADSDSHLKALMFISELLQDNKMVEQILNSKDTETLYNYFN